MASIYLEGQTWSARIRKPLLKAFKSGLPTRKEAETWVRNQEHALANQGTARGFGPERTSLAQALSDYAQKKMPFLKGAVQDVSRVNKYLRAAELASFKAIDIERTSSENAPEQVYFRLEVIPAKTKRKIANGLHQHREKQGMRSAGSDKIRATLARMTVASIQPYHLQALMDQMQKEAYGPATLQLERALLRDFFNYARRTWRWTQPALNPACDLRMPKVSNARNRVLSKEEQVRLENALASCKNPYVLSCIALLIETSMRKSELLLTAKWGGFDPVRSILVLDEAKAGGREVPLTKEAVELIQGLPRRGNDERIFPTTMAAIKSAWERALERANIENITLHDLRHTGATRMAIRLNGNIFLLQLVTGHKTLSQLQRYINLTAADAVDAFNLTNPKAVKLTAPPILIEANANTPVSMPSNVLSFSSARNRKVG